MTLFVNLWECCEVRVDVPLFPWISSWSAPVIEKIFLSLLNCFNSIFVKWIGQKYVGLFLDYFVPIYILSLIPNHLEYCSFWEGLEAIGKVFQLHSSFLIGSSRSFAFPHKLRIGLSISVARPAGLLPAVAVSLQTIFWECCRRDDTESPVYECGVSFQLFRSLKLLLGNIL